MLGRRVVVGLSGGVDSSVSALLLRECQKWDKVTGVFMRNWDPGDESGDSYTCPIAQDLRDATRVAKEIGVELHVVDFAKDYWNNVFEPYLDRFSHGTPNPDVFCNREIKFKKFKEWVAEEFGPECHLATGHYARLRNSDRAVQNVQDPPPQLLKGLDPGKDQSYFLSAVSGDALRNVHFPVGGLLKSQVRELAKDFGLSTAQKKDSVGICFVGKRRFPDFISDYLPERPGRFLTPDGLVLGSHRGLDRYTIGQGAAIGGLSRKSFVARKNMESGDIIVVDDPRHPMLQACALKVKADQMFWVAGHPPFEGSILVEAVVRYRQRPVSCRVEVDQSDGAVRVYFDHDKPICAVTTQQIVALYDGEVCLGGGVIDHVETLS